MNNEGLESAINRLVAVMAQLRNPDGGCPWDLEQNFATIAPYTIEEAYEVADAIERQDMAALKDELGDLLLQVVFHAQMAREAGSFDFEAVAAAIAEKMVRRHPHVFGDRGQDRRRPDRGLGRPQGNRAARQSVGRGPRGERAGRRCRRTAGPHARDQAAAARGPGRLRLAERRRRFC